MSQGNITIIDTMRHAAARGDFTDLDEDREFIYALISDRRVFDALATGNENEYIDLRGGIDDVLACGGLTSSELTRVLADYDLIIGGRSAIIAYIDKLQETIDQLDYICASPFGVSSERCLTSTTHLC